MRSLNRPPFQGLADCPVISLERTLSPRGQPRATEEFTMVAVVTWANRLAQIAIFPYV